MYYRVNMRKQLLPDFLIIPYPLLVDENLNISDTLVYGLIYWYSKLKLERCVAKSRAMAKMLKLSQRTVEHAIERLKKGGYIDTVYDQVQGVREIIPLVSFKSTTLDRVVIGGPLPSPGYTTTLVEEKNQPQIGTCIEEDIQSKNNTKVLLPTSQAVAPAQEEIGNAQTSHSSSDSKPAFDTVKKLIGYVAQKQNLPGLSNYSLQVKKVNELREMGYTIEQMAHAVDTMLEDIYWQKHAFNMLNVYNNIHKYVKKELPTPQEREQTTYKDIAFGMLKQDKKFVARYEGLAQVEKDKVDNWLWYIANGGKHD
jgi:DNA-binding transcriptional ArsR family regulator